MKDHRIVVFDLSQLSIKEVSVGHLFLDQLLDFTILGLDETLQSVNLILKHFDLSLLLADEAGYFGLMTVNKMVPEVVDLVLTNSLGLHGFVSQKLAVFLKIVDIVFKSLSLLAAFTGDLFDLSVSVIKGVFEPDIFPLGLFQGVKMNSLHGLELFKVVIFKFLP